MDFNELDALIRLINRLDIFTESSHLKCVTRSNVLSMPVIFMAVSK